MDWFPVKSCKRSPSMRPVLVPLAVLYWLARGAQSYLGTHYQPLVLGFAPPKTTEKHTPDVGHVAHAIEVAEVGINAEITMDALDPPFPDGASLAT